ncbi:MAG: toxin, Fic family [Betaproteobacteria bacterium]|nr:toxin, Fic family [Betaproteobacteria bacterium]
MAIEFEYPPGSTPLDPDEAAGLIPGHIATQGQLNEWEMANILRGEAWAFSRKHDDMLSPKFIRFLHKKLFEDTWEWAGKYRTTAKSIGIDAAQIGLELSKLCKDVECQLKYRSYPPDELAARFHHRLTWIHPFPNGNGRFSRTMADLLMVQNEEPRFSWGASDIISKGNVRTKYIAALKAADVKDYGPLLEFLRSGHRPIGGAG